MALMTVNTTDTNPERPFAPTPRQGPSATPRRIPRPPSDNKASPLGLDPTEHGMDAPSASDAQGQQQAQQVAYGNAWKELQSDPGKFANAQRRAGSVLLNRLRGQVSGSDPNTTDPNKVTLSQSEIDKANQRIQELSSGNYSSVTPEEVQAYVAPDLMQLAKAAASTTPRAQDAPSFAPGSKEALTQSQIDLNNAKGAALGSKGTGIPKPQTPLQEAQTERTKAQTDAIKNKPATPAKAGPNLDVQNAQKDADRAFTDLQSEKKKYGSGADANQQKSIAAHEAEYNRLKTIAGQKAAATTQPAAGSTSTVAPNKDLVYNTGISQTGEAVDQEDNQSVTQSVTPQPKPTVFAPTTPQQYSKAGITPATTPRQPRQITDQDVAQGNAYRQYAMENRNFAAGGSMPYPPASAANPANYRTGPGGMAFSPYAQVTPQVQPAAPVQPTATPNPVPAAQAQVDQQQQAGFAMLKDPNNKIMGSFPDPAGGVMHVLSNGAVIGGRGHLLHAAVAPQTAQPGQSPIPPVPAGIQAQPAPQLPAQPAITQPTASANAPSTMTSKSGKPIRRGTDGQWYYVE